MSAPPNSLTTALEYMKLSSVQPDTSLSPSCVLSSVKPETTANPTQSFIPVKNCPQFSLIHL